jgi:hypothetical protein
MVSGEWDIVNGEWGKFLNLESLKRFVAILLMGILCFNWYGYRLLDAYLESRADKQLEATLDRDGYDDAQLLLIKIPSTHLSYYNSSDRFERVDGQIDVGGIQYKYVKRRLYNDSLELLCIPDQGVMQLQKAKNEFFKLANGLQPAGQEKKNGNHPGVFKSFSPDKYTVLTIFHIGGPEPLQILHASPDCAPFSSIPPSAEGHPPELS